MPKRIQRKRTKGWKMPEGAVSVARPSLWGNPYKVGAPDPEPRRNAEPMTAERCVELHRGFVERSLTGGSLRDLTDLRGRDLACFCSLDAPCHADTLLELANR